MPECIYNPITAIGVLAMFTFQLDNTNIAGTPLGVVDTLGLCSSDNGEVAKIAH